MLVVALLVFSVYYPPEDKSLQTGTLSGVEKAERYRESTVSSENVVLQNAEQFQFLQSAAFQNLAKDPELLKVFFSSEFHSIYYTSQILALAAVTDILQQSEVMNKAELKLNNAGISAKELNNLTTDEKLQTIICGIAFENMDESEKKAFTNNVIGGMSLEQALLQSRFKESNIFKVHETMNKGIIFTSNAETFLQKTIANNVFDQSLLVLLNPAFTLDLIERLQASDFKSAEFNYVVPLTEFAGTILANNGDEKLGNVVLDMAGLQAVEIMQNALLKWANREGGLQGTEFNATEFLKLWSNAFESAYSDKISAAELSLFMANESGLNLYVSSNGFANRMESLQNTSLEGIIFTSSLLFGNEHFENLMEMATFKEFMNMPAELQQTVLQNAAGSF